MSTQLKVHPFYCTMSKSSSFKIEITYPQIQNLSYNFELKLQIFLQTLIPKITYSMVHEQTIHIPKKQIVFQNLQPTKMYKVQIAWIKKGISAKQNLKEEKTVFVCSEKIPEEESYENQIEQQVGDSAYGQFVKDNIQGYFDQYYHGNNQQSKTHTKSYSSSKANSIASSQQSIRNQSSKKKFRPQSKTSFCNSESLMKVVGQSDPFINKKNLQKYILEGRNSSSVKDYLTTKDYQCFNSFNKLYKNQTERRKHVEKTLLVSKAINMFGEIYSFQKEHGILSETNSLNRKEGQRKGKQFFRNDWFMGPFYSYDANERQMKKKDPQSHQ